MSEDIVPRASTVAEARRRLGGLSEEAFYNLVNSGELDTFKIGRRRYVSDAALADFIRRRESAERTRRSGDAA